MIKRPYKKNRKAAAKALYDLIKTYEKISYNTVYRNCFFSNRDGCWKYIGRAHDYSY